MTSRHSTLPWLDVPLQRFEARLARGQRPQALLIHGPAGTGRRHLALSMAARLLGTDWHPPIREPDDALTRIPHPDYWSVGLEEEASMIKVDQIRDFNQGLHLTSHARGWKVGLIWPAGRMNTNAANTLLKTLEEPPPATTLLLVADAPGRLPATIVSRCERIRLSAPARTLALDWLLAGNPDRAACERALAFACGAPLTALGVLGDGDGDGGGQGAGIGTLLAELGTEMQQLIDRSVPPTTLARAWARRDAEVCLRWLYLQAAELLRRTLGGRGEPATALAPLKIPGTAVNMTACCTYLDQVVEAQRLKDRSLNMEAMFADLLLWWYGAQGAAR
jgi:DNA polymerase-3 subunit delta'